MKLSDSCGCGATFSARGWSAASVAKVWAGWVNIHAACRDDTRELVVYTDDDE